MKKILLIDDTVAILEEVKDILEMEGFDVDTAKSATEGLLKLKADDHALIITDLRMPGLSGLELLEILKENPETDHLPVVLLSANAEEENIKKATELKAAGYLKKPCSAEVLLEKINNLIN